MTTLYIMLSNMAAEKRKPTAYEWTRFTEAYAAATKDRERSGWIGSDPIYDEGYTAGFDDATALAEEDARENPAGPYPYA